MSDPTANPAPGFYVAYDKGNKTQLLWRSCEALWSGRNPEWPDMARPTLPPGWTLGPSIAELLRDAARIEHLGKQGGLAYQQQALSWHNADELRALIDAEIARERKAEGG